MIYIANSAALDMYQSQVIQKCKAVIPAIYDMKVTRGHSSATQQLILVKEYAKACGATTPEMNQEPWNEKIVLGDGVEVYPWQRAWSNLLNQYYKSHGKQGKKINPPLAAICLYDYDGGRGNMKGLLINPSPHIIPLSEDPHIRPCPIDWSMRVNGVINEKITVESLNKCKELIPDIKGLTIEMANACVHMDLNRQGA